MKKLSILYCSFILMAGFMSNSVKGETVYCISQDAANQLRTAHQRGDAATMNNLKKNNCDLPEYNERCQGQCHLEFDRDGYPENVCPCYPVNL